LGFNWGWSKSFNPRLLDSSSGRSLLIRRKRRPVRIERHAFLRQPHSALAQRVALGIEDAFLPHELVPEARVGKVCRGRDADCQFNSRRS
jgi:hypothetical protein